MMTQLRNVIPTPGRQLYPVVAMYLTFALFGITFVLGDAASRGGSNYNWHNVNGCGPAGRDPYGVIANYDIEQSEIDGQLQDMFDAGQRVLRIGIFHHRGSGNGTVMDSTGGDLSSQNRTNFENLLTTIRTIGFTEVIIAFHPVGFNNPKTWDQYYDTRFQENWNLIVNLRPIIANSGLHYRIDLMNEGSPLSHQTIVKQYLRKMWLNYTYVFGKADTLGFSINGNMNQISQRVQEFSYIYKNNYPYLFDLHFYGDAGDSFTAAHNAFAAAGFNQGWIIGESFYNDAVSTAELQEAINETERLTFYLLQWPVTRPNIQCGVDIAPPEFFGNYISQGF